MSNKLFQLIEQKSAVFVDFRFTDLRGKWHHITHHVSSIDEDLLQDGVMFDGSSLPGWKGIQDSDMALIADPETAVMDPFTSVPTVVVFCDVHEPITGQPYKRDPRSVAKKAEQHMIHSGVADTAYFGPEAEFFVFDSAQFDTGMESSFYQLYSEEGPYASKDELGGHNLGHRPVVKGGYFPVPPVDSAQDMRSEMLTVLAGFGVAVERHHHEVAPSQHELGIRYDKLVSAADTLQIYKYVVQNVANSYSKSATFMAKPIYGDNGSGMHVHQSLWKESKPVFAGSEYADLSQIALYYIGGIIKHARVLNAFTNPTTNSYKRLIPGFEAPVLLAYSARNRSASCRIPYSTSPHGKRVEVRFPDPSCNSYLGFSAMLMAGLDGIANRVHPGGAIEKNLYDLPPEETEKIDTVCRSLHQALDYLEDSTASAFLRKGEVFSSDLIQGYVDLKREEVANFERAPHPVEFKMYYSI